MKNYSSLRDTEKADRNESVDKTPFVPVRLLCVWSTPPPFPHNPAQGGIPAANKVLIDGNILLYSLFK